MIERIDHAATAAQLALGFLTALSVGCIVTVGLRRVQLRIDGMRDSYVASLEQSADRARILADMGTSARIASLVAEFGRSRLASGLYILAVCGIVVITAMTELRGVAAVMLLATLVLPYALAQWLDHISRVRIQRLNRALPDAVTILASCLSAGLTLPQSLRSVATALPGQLGNEFRIAANQVATGASESEALRAMAARSGSEYVGLFCAAARLHVAHGGNLGAALRELEVSVRRILIAEEDIRAKTAGVRREAKIVTVIPFVVVPLLVVIDPQMFGALFTTPMGIILLSGAIGIWIFSARRLHQITHAPV